MQKPRQLTPVEAALARALLGHVLHLHQGRRLDDVALDAEVEHLAHHRQQAVGLHRRGLGLGVEQGHDLLARDVADLHRPQVRHELASQHALVLGPGAFVGLGPFEVALDRRFKGRAGAVLDQCDDFLLPRINPLFQQLDGLRRLAARFGEREVRVVAEGQPPGMAMKAVQQDETFACLVDPHAEGPVPRHGWIEVLHTPFLRIVLEPFEGVFVHRSPCAHSQILTIPGVGLG
ncbi:hypothetical protein FQZ97_723430 [compost metagenome]